MVSKFGIPFSEDISNIFLCHAGAKVGINIIRHPRCRMSHIVLALFVGNAQDKEVSRKSVPQAVNRNVFNSQLAAEPLQPLSSLSCIIRLLFFLLFCLFRYLNGKVQPSSSFIQASVIGLDLNLTSKCLLLFEI